MTRFGSIWLLLLVGCKAKEEPPIGDDDDDDSVVETADTAPDAPPAKLTAEVRFRAFIAWDGALDQVVNPFVDGDDYLSVYLIELYEAGWSSADETTYCQVLVELEGTPLALGVVPPYQWGIDIPAGLDDKVVASDCLDKGFDAAQFEGEDPSVQWGEYDWQMRFGGVLDPDLIDWLTPDPTTGDFDINEYAAGGWSTETASLDTSDDNNYWYAYAMDAAYNVDFDTRMPAVAMVDGLGSPVTAYFVFDQRVYWDITPPTTE